MAIKFYSDQYFYSRNKKKILDISHQIFNSDLYTNGKNVKKLENLLKKKFKAKYCIATSSGTSALHLALKSLNIKHNDEVITSSNSFIATPMSIIYCGAKPKFIDSSIENWNINIDLIERNISKKTKAIMPVHLHGHMCDMKAINQIAKKYKLKIVEDASQAYGARNQNYQISSLSDLATLSFYPTKNLGTFGEGGAVLTNNKKLYEKIIRMRNWDKGNYQLESYNYRMAELSAAIVVEKIKHSNDLLYLRDQVKEYYLSKLDLESYQFQKISDDCKHSNHIFGILVNQRDLLLKNTRVEFLSHYNYSLPYLKIFKSTNLKNFKISKHLSKKLLSLPIYPGIKKKELDIIIDIVNKHNKLYKYNYKND